MLDQVVLPAEPHPLHAADRHWPQSNCSLDLWIGYLHSRGLAPEALMAALVELDHEGDQFTFCKFDMGDLTRLHGLVLRELAIFDRLQEHVAVQVARGNLVLVELDGFHLPDTRATSYQREHTKTTVGINHIDAQRRQLGYFHNSGYYTLGGADYEALFAVDAQDRQAGATLFPYTEFVLDRAEPLQGEALRLGALETLRQHLTLAPARNPFLAYQSVFDADLCRLIERGNDFFHIYAFNHFRQFGAVFGFLGAFALWLDPGQGAETAGHCEQIAAKAKLMQFRVARAVARGRADDSGLILDDVARHWEAAMAGLRRLAG